MAKNKKEGKTEVYPFWYMEDIKNIMDYFKSKEMWHWYLAFNLGLLLGRRVSDTLSFRWDNFFFKNGRMRDETEIIEEKTNKPVRLYVCGACKEALNLYIDKTGINPMKNYNDFIFSKRKTDLLKDKDKYTDEEYKVLYDKCTQSDAGAYRKQLKAAVKACNIQYPISTHSTRKTFGYWSVKLHPYDVTTIDKLQGIFNHSDRNITLRYIGIAREDEIKLYEDMGSFVSDVSNGKKPVIKNSPVIPLKSEDFRELLSKCYDMGKNGKDKFDAINEIINMSEQLII